MNQEELRLHRCCFTGHRPDKMEFGEKDIKLLLEKAIDEAIAEGYVTFITGMAMGTDMKSIGTRRKNFIGNMVL